MSPAEREAAVEQLLQQARLYGAPDKVVDQLRAEFRELLAELAEAQRAGGLADVG